MIFKLRKLNDCRTDAERWAFHTEHYAWRILRGLASFDDRTSGVDPTGDWYDADAIRRVLAEMRAAERRHATQPPPLDERQAAIEAQEEKYRRAAAWRAGKLDEYDAIHWPERLAERRKRGAASELPITAGDLGVTASPSDTGGLQHVADALPERAAE